MSAVLQYIVVRRDLITKLGWPLGAIVAQGCHAATAAIHSFHDCPDTVVYLEQLDRMHKVVLGVDGEPELRALHEKLASGNIDHYLWTEQPENICTALATRPYTKSTIQSYFKGLKLLG
ncbi:unnamed protein product [Calicophoron daubneyi]|uniref:peptidyl-tRNA hydrolase n=1 Tax=Calicophoron daubneyi TaxID=300641 RepID=A0AAV2T4I0_CALDB